VQDIETIGQTYYIIIATITRNSPLLYTLF